MRPHIFAISVSLLLTLAIVPSVTAGAPGPGDQGPFDVHYRVQEQARFATELMCGSPADPAYPIFFMQGNGGSWVKLYESLPHINPGDTYVTTDIYVSWSLQTNNIVAGADEWAFGIEVASTPMETVMGVAYGERGPDLVGAVENLWGHLFSSAQSNSCSLVASLAHRWMEPTPIYFYYDAGAMAWFSQTSCTTTTSWEEHIGASISIDDAGVEAKLVLGGAYACSDGAVFDSESLLRGGGSASSLPCLDCDEGPALWE